MDNYKIVIDAGHGGDDPGSSGNGIIEKDLTLKISQYMYDLFSERGIPVTMTRTTDETLTPDERVNRILSAYGNNKNVIVISNHINAGGGDGAEVIYALRNNNKLSNLILDNFKTTGQNVRDAYQRRLPSDTSKDYYFIHRNTGNTEAIIVEYGFLDSTLDDPEQLKNDYKMLTQAVVNAVLKYIGYKQDNNVYIVKSGDSLWAIAKRYGITVEQLKKANNLTSNTLSIGQKLIIPTNEIITPSQDYTLYTVKSGDSLYSISKKYGLTINELMEYNNLGTTILRIGQTLKIPLKQTSPAVTTYIVKSGDSLYSIAKKYNTTVNELMKYNNLTSNLLSIGQVLKIPATDSIITNYTVKSGDTLYSISKKYNITVDEIKRKNNLTNNTLSIGQTLII